ncbi:hypothetical protein LTR78_007500 [Recurvomyces mirabilis]|uniref:Uncharacterized protein n=1 Tax=Recurvomyces mirabilis TaxID=574656 RepID=A0AAE0TVF3_9PEZI|nr:hypothetical protein LTR78_007500 [Recurvomyces mirabilis]KAK5159990.1 hypothetical protein LTS14_002096 [Recurvomyces mirabilis]
MDYKLGFLDLPTEVRQVILQHALKQTGRDAYDQPLFAVHTIVRAEALEAFYKANTFLWIIDHCGTLFRSDPVGYPGMGTQPEWWQPNHESETATTYGVTVAVPWLYPDLKKHLRHLQINITLPSISIREEAEATETWSRLRVTIRQLIEALDHGRTLDTLGILFTASRHFNGRVPLMSQQLEILELLAEFQVRHRVSVSTRLDFKEAAQSVRSLNLEKRMVAHHT